MKKTWLVILLIALVSASAILAGCGGDDGMKDQEHTAGASESFEVTENTETTVRANETSSREGDSLWGELPPVPLT